MKKIRIIEVLILSFFFLSTSAFSKNLITNNGFEDVDDQGRAIGWIYSDTAAVVDSSISFLGNRSMYMSVADTSNTRLDQYVDEISGGETYNFSTWVLTLGDNKKAYVRLKVEWLDRNNKYVSGNNSPSLMFSTSEEWRKLSYQVKAPPEAARARLLVRLYGPGEAWYDEVYFSKEPGTARLFITQRVFHKGDNIDVEFFCEEKFAGSLRWSLVKNKEEVIGGEIPILSERFKIQLPTNNLEEGFYCLKIFSKGEEDTTFFSEIIYLDSDSKT